MASEDSLPPIPEPAIDFKKMPSSMPTPSEILDKQGIPRDGTIVPAPTGEQTGRNGNVVVSYGADLSGEMSARIKSGDFTPDDASGVAGIGAWDERNHSRVVGASDSGLLQFGESGKGLPKEVYNCELAVKIQTAVRDAMKDGGISPQEASQLRELLGSLPAPETLEPKKPAGEPQKGRCNTPTS